MKNCYIEWILSEQDDGSGTVTGSRPVILYLAELKMNQALWSLLPESRLLVTEEEAMQLTKDHGGDLVIIEEFYGISCGLQGTSAGSIVEVYELRMEDERLQGQVFGGEWVDIFSAFYIQGGKIFPVKPDF